MSHSFDDFWEKTYDSGEQLNKYPYDSVVSFVFRNFPRSVPRNQVRILEVGCGAGNNMWFAAKEGFDCYGIDGSKSAISFAKARFEKEGLNCSFEVADFIRLPYQNDFFDLAIDRCAITETGFSHAKVAINEVRRVLKPGGMLHFNPYSKNHISYKVGNKIDDCLVENINKGLTRAGKTCFWDYRMILDSFSTVSWKLENALHKELSDHLSPEDTHSEWLIYARKL